MQSLIILYLPVETFRPLGAGVLFFSSPLHGEALRIRAHCSCTSRFLGMTHSLPSYPLIHSPTHPLTRPPHLIHWTLQYLRDRVGSPRLFFVNLSSKIYILRAVLTFTACLRHTREQITLDSNRPSRSTRQEVCDIILNHDRLLSLRWNHLLGSSSMLLSTTYHFKTRAPARSSQSDGENGAKNATSAALRSREKVRWFVGTRTSHRTRTESLHMQTTSRFNIFAGGATLHSSAECSSASVV